MKKIKRLVAMVAASMLLCGFMCQAAEGSVEKEAPEVHFHEYEYQSSTCTGSTNVREHSYVSGVIHKPWGPDETVYGTCTVVLFYYRDLYKCKCGDKLYRNHDKEEHMNCGL